MEKSSLLEDPAMLRNKMSGSANIIHFAFHKSRSICKSVLSSGLFAFVEGFVVGYSVTGALAEMWSINVLHTTYVDNHFLFGLCICLASTTERRTQIDLPIVIEAYEKQDLSDMVLIAGESNQPDHLIEAITQNGTLSEVVRTDHCILCAESWINFDENEVSTMEEPGTDDDEVNRRYCRVMQPKC